LGPSRLSPDFSIDSANFAGSADGSENTVVIRAPEAETPSRTIGICLRRSRACALPTIFYPLRNRFENNPKMAQKIPQQ